MFWNKFWINNEQANIVPANMHSPSNDEKLHATLCKPRGVSVVLLTWEVSKLKWQKIHQIRPKIYPKSSSNQRWIKNKNITILQGWNYPVIGNTVGFSRLQQVLISCMIRLLQPSGCVSWLQILTISYSLCTGSCMIIWLYNVCDWYRLRQILILQYVKCMYIYTYIYKYVYDTIMYNIYIYTNMYMIQSCI